MVRGSSARQAEGLMQSSGWRSFQQDGTKEDGPEAVDRLESDDQTEMSRTKF